MAERAAHRRLPNGGEEAGQPDSSALTLSLARVRWARREGSEALPWESYLLAFLLTYRFAYSTYFTYPKLSYSSMATTLIKASTDGGK